MKIKNSCRLRTKCNGCRKLNVKQCNGSSCSFAQTKEQSTASRRKSFNRLARLSYEHQSYIAEKYYGGKMPWLKGGAGYDN